MSSAWDVAIDRKPPRLPGAHILAGVSEKKTRCKPLCEIIEYYCVCFVKKWQSAVTESKWGPSLDWEVTFELILDRRARPSHAKN